MDDERTPETPSLTAQELKRQFAERLHQADNDWMTGSLHTSPCYPMMILSMGDGAAALSDSIEYGLKRLWPAYANDLTFVKAALTDDAPVFTRPGETKALSDKDIGDMTARLFSLTSHFPKTNRLLLYAVLDTSGFEDPKELSLWLDALDAFRRAVRVNVPMLTLLAVLLNEDPNHYETGEETRNRLGAELSRLDDTPALLLVSNLRNDDRIDDDWTMCRRLTTAVVTVSNNEEEQVLETLFREGSVMTASYALAEKPVAEISQICVEKLLEELKKFAPAEAGDLFGENVAQTKKGLGIDGDGCFSVLDDYIERNLPRYVPTGGELKSLLRALPIAKPNASWSDRVCEEDAAEVINKQTFGAWNCYLEKLVRQARENLQSRSSEVLDWEQAYYDNLRRNFHARALVELSQEENLGRIREFSTPAEHPPANLSIQETAKQRLKYLLSSDAEIRERLLSKIDEAGREAAAFIDAWNKLLRSAKELKPIVCDADNENFIRYYQQQLTYFFDSNGDALKESFRNIADPPALTAFFRDVMDRIFGDKDKELQKAFKGSFSDVGMMQIERTRATLTGEHVHIYLNVHFSPQKLMSFILLNEDEGDDSLYSSLKAQLSDQTRFYETGRKSEAESLTIYSLDTYELGVKEAEA